jgi:hypothetical protein
MNGGCEKTLVCRLSTAQGGSEPIASGGATLSVSGLPRGLRWCFLAAIVVVAWATQAIPCPAQSAAPAPDFNRDIRPILSNHCFKCHGSDEGSREAELRLDQREAAVVAGAIDPEAPDESALLVRILSDDPDLRMPPASGKPLSPQQIELLQRWVRSGAEYAEHWAFQRIVRPAVPADRNDPWCRNEIDAFVLQRLRGGPNDSPRSASGRRSELAPSRPAEPAVLLRRLTMDLTGLLPTLDEVAEFAATDPDATWPEQIDRLLNSPHYGERWGRHWLDQARYADSNGYTIDSPRVMWPYRDWVIRALNDDLPFDQFTIEQLAGDLVPGATRDQKIATAFHRNTMINEEGGVKPDQFRHEALIDRVNTTGAVWLGLTIGCAQCHSHKFDPVSHEDYYRLYAFFNGAADANNVGETVEVREGELLGWSAEQQQWLAALTTLQAELNALKSQSATGPDLLKRAWDWQPATVVSAMSSGAALLSVEAGGSILTNPAGANRDVFTIRVSGPVDANGQPVPVTAIRLRTLPHESLPAKGPGTAGNGNFVLSDISLRHGDESTQRFLLAGADHSQPNFPVEHAIDDNSKTGWAINADGKQIAMGVSMNSPHTAVFALAPGAAVSGDFDVILRHDVNRDYLVGHFAIDVSTAAAVTESEAGSGAVRRAELAARISELEQQLPGKGIPAKQMVMQDQSQPPETFLLTRGDFLTPDRDRGALQPGVPRSLLSGRNSADDLTSRLDLARWLVSRDNPLTARVAVNRIWAKYFGRGLVETENDFGYQGTPPTHPELLDWLAAEFMESGWSVKHMHRLIVNSATYRQSSRVTPQHAVDPDNRLLARQTRFRVEAEIVRDLALSASGLLNLHIGGPSVHLPQPEGIYDFTQNKKDWPTATGTDRYRRTMYAMFYRSAPYPLLSTFDAPDFSTVCTCRTRSNTPLQSLTTANDPVFQELALGLARRLMMDDVQTSDELRLQRAFRLCLTRGPESAEILVLQEFLDRERARFRQSATDAAQLTGHAAGDPVTVELAAWASVARLLFNSDEFVMRN